MVAVVLRLAALAALAARLVLASGGHEIASGAVPALVTAFAVAIAIATEPRLWLRHALYTAVLAIHVAWVLRDDGWHTAWFWSKFALLVVAEGAALLPFLETRLWRWSLAPGLALVAWLGYHVVPGYANPVVLRHATWLAQALAFLCANAAVRSIHAEDAEDAARS